MRRSRPAFLPVVLGFLVLVTLIAGPGAGGFEGTAAPAHGAADPVGFTDSPTGGDAVLVAQRETRDGVGTQRVRPPRTIVGFTALAIGAAVVLVRRRRRLSVAGRPRLATIRRAGGGRAPPLLRSA